MEAIQQKGKKYLLKVCPIERDERIDLRPSRANRRNIIAAARKLAQNVKTVHLSDFAARRAHAFIGEGELVGRMMETRLKIREIRVI